MGDSTMKTALVTGAAGGIGQALVSALIRAGHRVMATDRDESALSAAAKACAWPNDQILLRPLDVTDPEAWDRAMAAMLLHWERIDILGNIAGFLSPGWIADLTVDDISRHLDVNVRGVILGTQAAARLMKRQGSGHIITMGSLAALAPVPGLSLYCASKFAVRGFTLAIAEELGPDGVAVSLVLPDAVQTPMLELQRGREEAALTFSGARTLTAEEVAQAIVDTVLPKRPLELMLPITRGALAKVAGALPQLSRRLGPMLRKRGLKRMKRG